MAVESSGNAKFFDDTKSAEQPVDPGVKKTPQNLSTGVGNEEFNKAHERTDVDRDHMALHHTLGFGSNQGIPGAILENIAPIGELKAYAGPLTKVPVGFMPADGRSLNVADYPALFKKIGYAYGGAGPNFSIPDSRNRPLIGIEVDSQLARNDGLSVGSRTMSIPSHNHALSMSATTSWEDDHKHTGSATTTSAGSHAHSFSGTTDEPDNLIDRAAGAGTAGSSAHRHSYSGNTGTTPNHQHSVSSINLDWEGAHDHDVTVTGTTASAGNKEMPYLKVTAMIRYSWGL